MPIRIIIWFEWFALGLTRIQYTVCVCVCVYAYLPMHGALCIWLSSPWPLVIVLLIIIVNQIQKFCFSHPAAAPHKKLSANIDFHLYTNISQLCNIRIVFVFVTQSKENKLNTRWLPKNWWINLHIWHRPIFGGFCHGHYHGLVLFCYCFCCMKPRVGEKTFHCMWIKTMWDWFEWDLGSHRFIVINS